ncbi:MAG: TRAP transporter substrate-binding protein [Afipia sp.]
MMTTGRALIAAVALLICTQASASQLRLGGVHAPNSFETQALNKFAELASEKSGGSLQIKVFPAGQLGAAQTMIDMISTGAIDMFANVADWNQNLESDFAILSMPFTFHDLDHLKSFLASDSYQAMKKKMLEEKHVRVVADNWYRLPRILLTRQPVASIKDVAGLKLRMPNIESFIKTWSAFGAKPTIIPFSEAFISMKTGVVDGMEAPLSSIYSQKFYQVAPYIAMTNHGLAPFNVLMNERSYEALPDREKKALTDAGEEAGRFYVDLIKQKFSDQKAKMISEGAKFVDIPLQPFAEKAKVVAEDFESRGVWPKGLFAKIQTMAPSSH